MTRLGFVAGAVLAGTVLAAAVTAAGQAGTQDAAMALPAAPSAELDRRASIIKPTADELRWQRILWLTDLAAAQRVARKEGRPLLLWVTGDDPLERC